MSIFVISISVSCIEAEQESSASLVGILLDLLFSDLVTKKIIYSAPIKIFVALNLLCTETILFYAFFKFVSPFCRLRHVRIHKFISIIKHSITSIMFYPSLSIHRAFSELAVVLVAEDKADLLVGFEVAADHAGIVKDLGSPFD